MITAKESDIERRKQEMLDSLPPYYQESPEANAIMRGNASEIERKRAEAQDLLDQMFVSTATWGLDYWDRVLDLVPAPRMTIEKRRERILAKLNGTGVASATNLEKVANTFLTYGKSELKDFPSIYTFHLIISSLNDDISEIRKTIKELKPAHLKSIFVWLDKSVDEWSLIQDLLLKKKLRPDTTWWGGQYNPSLGVLINGSWRINGGFLLNATASEEDPINKVFFRETMKTEKVFHEYEENLSLILDGNWTLNNIHTLDNPPKLVKLRPIEHDLSIFERKVYERRIDGTWYLDGSLTVGVQRLMNGSWSMDGEYLMDGNRMQKL